MFFRIYIVLILVSVMLLCTDLWSVGLIASVWLVLIMPIGIKARYKRWRLGQMHCDNKSLSFCIKSMNRQKQNFKMIKRIFASYPSIERFFKGMSIVMDDISIKSSNLESSYNYDEDYVMNPMYKHLIINIYYEEE